MPMDTINLALVGISLGLALSFRPWRCWRAAPCSAAGRWSSPWLWPCFWLRMPIQLRVRCLLTGILAHGRYRCSDCVLVGLIAPVSWAQQLDRHCGWASCHYLVVRPRYGAAALVWRNLFVYILGRVSGHRAVHVRQRTWRSGLYRLAAAVDPTWPWWHG